MKLDFSRVDQAAEEGVVEERGPAVGAGEMVDGEVAAEREDRERRELDGVDLAA